MINTPKYIQLGLFAMAFFLTKLSFYIIFEIQIYLILLRNSVYYVIINIITRSFRTFSYVLNSNCIFSNKIARFETQTVCVKLNITIFDKFPNLKGTDRCQKLMFFQIIGFR